MFVEPEGLDQDTLYRNGMSSSLPEDVQQLPRDRPRARGAVLMRPGYAVEYDYAPAAAEPDLETKTLARLFLAGQINGTTGYEEAAAQGLLAGINAARLRPQAPWCSPAPRPTSAC